MHYSAAQRNVCHLARMPKLRLAPTPSGLLHLGNGVNFVLNAAWALQLGGQLTLRIDDLDSARVRGEYLNDIDDTVRWLFPDVADGLIAGALVQSRRAGRYAGVLDALRQNRLVYACACSRKQIRAAQEAAGTGAGDVNAYPGTCRERELPLDAEHVTWRMREDDTIVRLRNSKPSYQLASVIDDVDSDITHVYRGQDLASSTRMQQVLAKALAEVDESFAAFAKTHFKHHPLLTDRDGSKLSKRDGAESLRALRQNRVDRTVVVREAGKLLGRPDVRSLEELGEVIGYGN